MVEQVEEVRAEPQILPFAELEGFAESEIDILLRRADDAVAWRVAIKRTIARRTVGKRRQRVGLVSSGVHPVGDARLRTSVAGSTTISIRCSIGIK